MRNARSWDRNHNPDLTFSPLQAWLSSPNWGGAGTGVGLRRAPHSLQTPQGDPSPYLVDSAPYIISQARAIRKVLDDDITKEATRLEAQRRARLMPEWERLEHDRRFGPGMRMGDDGLQPIAQSDWETKTVEELVKLMAEREYMIQSRGFKPEWFSDESRLLNLTRANRQIQMFADMLQEADFSSVPRNFENPYYGILGPFLPKQEFPAPRRVRAASTFSRQNLRGGPRRGGGTMRDEDIPF